jgi:hypothetical protein
LLAFLKEECIYFRRTGECMSISVLPKRPSSPKATGKNSENLDVNRVLRLLKNAQFNLGKKTDAVKIIRRDRG